MAKVRAKFRARTKGNYFTYYTDKYKTKTFNVELPKSNFHEHYKPIDIGALEKLIQNLIDTEYPETYNKLLNFEIVQ